MVTNCEQDTVDSKDAKIIVLASKIKKLECTKGGKDANKYKRKSKNYELDPQYTKHKSSSIIMDEKALWQCKHYKNLSCFPHGLCMPHKHKDYDAWKKARDEKDAKHGKGKAGKLNQQLKLQDILKVVLMKNYTFSKEIVESIYEDMKNKSGRKDFQKA